jgi:tRNA-specific 2-thiouridylase
MGGPARYVTEINPATAEVRVAPGDRVFVQDVEAAEASWLGPLPRPGEVVQVKIRSRFAAQPAYVVEADEHSFRVVGDAGFRAVTPGQAAVLYDGERVIGGGWIRTGLQRTRTDAPAMDHASG